MQRIKKIILLCALVLAVPALSHAALRVPQTQSPLQPIPENNAPNIKSNTNTPGNDFNSSQDEIQAQQPADESMEPAPQIAVPVIAAQQGNNAGYYVILILVCSGVLVVMLGWLVYRYRIKKD